MTLRRAWEASVRSVLASLCLATGVWFTAGPASLAAQEEVSPELQGTLYLGEVPADTGTVVLHWVTPEQSGVVDSTRVDAEGGFSLALPHVPIPNSGEVFFASARFDGVLYTGSYISDPIQLDSLYAIRTYPRQAAPAGGLIFPLSQREVWIDPGPSGWRITDVLDIQNPNPASFVPNSSDDAVWRYPIPPTARNPQIVQVGPIVGEASFEGTTLIAANTLVPGDNYYIIQYEMESIEFDLPLPGETGLVRMFVREPAPDLRVTGLALQGPTDELEVGAVFDIWAAQNLRDQNIEVRLGGEGDIPPVVWLVTTLSLVFVVAGSFVIRKRLGDGRAGVGRERQRKDILVDVATLDEEYARIGEPSGQDEVRYRRRRAGLVDELARAGGTGSVQEGP